MPATRFLQRRSRLSSQTGWLGIDLGRQSIKIAQVQRRPDGTWHLLRARAFDVTPGASPLDRLPAAISQTLDRRRRWFGVPTACVLSASATPLQCIDLPTGDTAEQITTLARELQTAAPLLETAFTYWPATWMPASSQSVPHQAACLGHRQSTEIAEQLQSVGLRTEVLDLLPYCLARAVDMRESDPNQTFAAIDLGMTDPTLTVIRGGQPFYTRSLKQCGLQGLIDSLSQRLGIEPEDAGRLLTRQHEASERQQTWSESLRETIKELTATGTQRLVDEIVRSMDYLRSENESFIPGQVYLFGGGSLISHIEPLIREAIQIPTQRWTLGADDGASNRRATSVDSLFGPAIALSAIPLCC